MKYYVTFKVDAHWEVEVEADNVQEAIREAGYRFCDADFGEAEEIYGDAIIVEDERGNYVFEK